MDINSILINDLQSQNIPLILVNFPSIKKSIVLIPILLNFFVKIISSFLFLFNIFIFDSISSFISLLKASK